MSGFEALRKRVQQEVGRYQALAKESGVPYSTLCKIGQGATVAPRADNVFKLLAYFASKDRASSRTSKR